jgi:hypothetical protein
MSVKEKIKEIFKPRLKLAKGTRFTSFLFIAVSLAISALVLLAANMYYNIDTGEVVVEEIQRVSRLIRATGGLIVGGTQTSTLPSGVGLEIATTSAVRLSGANQELRFTGGTSFYVGIKAPTSLSSNSTYTLPPSYPAASGYVLTSDTSGNLSWAAAGTGGIGDITTVGDCGSGDCFTVGGTTSTTLWFKSGSYYGALNVGSLTANATYTLPAVSAGTYYFILASSGLTANQIPYMTGAYTVGGSPSLTFDATNRILTVGSSSNTGQLRLYSNNVNYVGFTATSSLGSTVTYYWPGAPTASGRVLMGDTAGNLWWQDLGAAGYGDISTVGDCVSGDCFTQTGGSGNNLWFITGGGGRIQLTGASTASNYTVTLPAANGTIALGTGGANQVAYWTGTNTLTGTSTLPTSMGGTGANSSAWNGMVRVVGGNWGAVQGTAGYAAYWSDANTVAAEQYLSVSRGGTGKGSWTQWGVLYADGSTSLNNVATSTTYAILTANNAAAPSWRTISDLVSVSNGLTANGTTQLSIKLGGTLTENTTIALAGYDMIFNLTGTGDFRIQNNGSDVFVVNDSGQILYKNSYPLAQTGKQVLREMVPIFGFDLPVKTATTSYIQISRTIVNYPLNPCESGASRVHKLVIRYGATASSTWQVATSSTGYTEVTVPSTGATSTGSVYTISTSIPTPSGSCTGWNQGTETDDWWVRMKLNGTGEIMIYQIFLAGYDELP